MDAVIVSAIVNIQDRLPGFKMYEKIYKGDEALEKRLRKDILLAYSSFVKLAIEGTKFYLDSGISVFSPTMFQWYSHLLNTNDIERTLVVSNLEPPGV